MKNDRVKVPEDISNLTREELIELKVKVEASHRHIKDQIDNAKAGAVSGDYADPGWFSRLQAANRALGWHANRINAELGKRRNGNCYRIERSFIEVCKRRLDPVLFRSLMDEAHDETRVSP